MHQNASNCFTFRLLLWYRSVVTDPLSVIMGLQTSIIPASSAWQAQSLSKGRSSFDKLATAHSGIPNLTPAWGEIQ